jgi:hypothetical protein
LRLRAKSFLPKLTGAGLLALPLLRNRRYTRLTNAHSKSLRHHKAIQALFVAWYIFGRKHMALKDQTPAMASRLTDHVWTIKELIERAAEI